MLKKILKNLPNCYYCEGSATTFNTGKSHSKSFVDCERCQCRTHYKFYYNQPKIWHCYFSYRIKNNEFELFFYPLAKTLSIYNNRIFIGSMHAEITPDNIKSTLISYLVLS